MRMRIGLIIPPADTAQSNRKAFSLGIDAGIVFKDSRISHNKTSALTLNLIEQGLFTCLNCDTQTTSKTISWDELGITSIQTVNEDDSIEKVG